MRFCGGQNNNIRVPFCSVLVFWCIHSALSFRAMTLSSSDSPNCVVRSLENQLEATTFGKDADDDTSSGTPASASSAGSFGYSSPMIKGAATADESGIRSDDKKIKLPVPIYQVRNLIFQLSAITGSLSALFWQRMPLDNHGAAAEERKVPQEVVDVMVQLLRHLMDLSTALSIDLGKACMAKIALNNRKYPVKLCKVRIVLSADDTFVWTVHYGIQIY